MIEALGLEVPMRDGVRLAADVVRPADGAPCPAIVELTPYGRGPEHVNFRNEADFWTRHGYALAIVDCRGQGDSEGEFSFLAHEGEDAHDVVTWLAAQPWCDGTVAMRGASYSGTNQWLAARERPAGLRCIVPDCATRDPYAEIAFPGGCLHLGWALTWATALALSPIAPGAAVDWEAVLAHRPLGTADEVAHGRPLPFFRFLLEHASRDAFWSALPLRDEDYRAIEVPSLSFSGWFDGTLTGTVEHFQRVQRLAPVPADHFLVVGPWGHATAPEGGHDYRTGEPVRRLGDLELPDAAFLPAQELTRAFYDWRLRGGERPGLAPVTVFVTGWDRWLELPSYPPPAVHERVLHLGASGTLGWEPPAPSAPDAYAYDPARPAPSVAADRAGEVGPLVERPVDLGPLIERPDVLAYTSDALTEPLALVGWVRLVLWAASDASDTDFVALVEDVDPDGRGLLLGSNGCGAIRARHRHGGAEAGPLVPGEPVELTLDLGPFGHALLPGHRLRLSVTSSHAPRLRPNPNTGHPIATDVDAPRIARQQVFHDPERPSRLLLDVLADPT